MTQEIRSPMAATVVEFAVAAGQAVRAGDLLAIVEAMKMEHELRAPRDARVLALLAQPGELVGEGDGLLRLGPVELREAATVPEAPVPVTAPLRADLREFLDREALLHDAARPEAVARRHARRPAHRARERRRPVRRRQLRRIRRASPTRRRRSAAASTS